MDERQAAADAARAALDAKQAEYDARLAVCREQLRALQRLDGGGAVWLLAQAKSLYQLLTFDAVLQQMSARNSTVLAELDAEAAALEQARAAADEAARQAADAKAALEQQQAALADTQTALESALLDAEQHADRPAGRGPHSRRDRRRRKRPMRTPPPHWTPMCGSRADATQRRTCT